ncbi:alpha/beta hydrolase [Nocardioides marinquilinus]|uniref:Alpha/beta hydrolase n=1 Tax=Nocardioides marinquilinus TaxID=1210400 RepID=A0ABP9P9B6_9ACTN
MDLIPKPGQVVSAAGNLATQVLRGGLADLRPMPSTLVHDGPLISVRHYRPVASVREHGDPVLLVAPLAVPARCYDLRRGCSLVEHLVGRGRPTYLVEHGRVDVGDRSLGVERWGDDLVPDAVRTVSAHAGGRPVHLVGWSLGGTFALLAATDPDLPIGSVTVVATPADVDLVPLVAPPRPLLDPTAGRGTLPRAVRAAAAAAGPVTPLVSWAAQLGSVQRLALTPAARLVHADDADYLAQLEAVAALAAGTTAYRGRAFGQVYHRFLAGADLDLSGVTAPTLVVAGATDGIAPVAAVQALLPRLTGVDDVQLEVVPGGHLGSLTGRAARTDTWPAIDEWVEQWSGRPDPSDAPVAPTIGTIDTIGTDPQRRHRSQASRALRD